MQIRWKATSTRESRIGRGIKGSFRAGSINFPERGFYVRAFLLLRARIERNRAYKRGAGLIPAARSTGRRMYVCEGTMVARDEWSFSLSRSLLLGVLKDCITGKMACLIRPFIRRATAGPAVKSEGAFVYPETSAGVPAVSARTRVLYTLYVSRASDAIIISL